jgi:hypothetical protein
MTCSKNKLSKIHREKRELDEKKACQKENPVFKKPSDSKSSVTNVASLIAPSLTPSLSASLSASLTPVSRDDDSSDYSSSDETVSSKSSSDSKTSVDSSKESITLVIEEIVSEVVLSEVVLSEVVLSDPVVSEVIVINAKNEMVVNEVLSEVNSEVEQSKAILINASKLIMDITASDDFNIDLDSSKQVADLIQKLLNL